MADNILQEVSQDEKLIYLRESREYAQMEIDWGLQMAEKKARLEIASNFKALKISNDQIAECTGLTIKEIEAL